MSINKNSKILTIGWDHRLIRGIFLKVQKNTNLDFAHFVYPKEFNFLNDQKITNFELYEIQINKKEKDKVNFKLLEELEKGANITFNNLILSDRVLREKTTDEALYYLSTLAEQMYDYVSKVSPLYLLGSWDSVLQGVGMLVARKLDIPFVVFKYSVIPRDHLAICTYPNNNDEIPFTSNNYGSTYLQAKDARDNWIAGLEDVPAYVSAKTFLDVIRLLPKHVNVVLNRIYSYFKFGGHSFIEPKISFLFLQYMRKKSNIIFMAKSLFIDKVPTDRFIFYGLHMQPESTIDVMAPFYSNQLEVIRSISRAAPTNFKILVKIHVSDADNYSSRQLKEFLKIPNVLLVSPFVESREFIFRSDLLVSIQGTIALEGALLGKPVIVFGDSAYLKFDTVEKVNIIEDLPLLVEKQLARNKATEEQILNDYTNLLLNYLPSSSDDWPKTLKDGLSSQQVINYTAIFDQITQYIKCEKFKYLK
ncbi:hypothetical protein OAF68_01620 [Akkermansiaceae bacterium]|nr:hypothetical protein [Akkermansiaceae bacterium]